MHGTVEYEVWRQRSEQMRHDVAANRLKRKLRANRGGWSRLARDLRWDLARYAGLLGKLLRGIR